MVSARAAETWRRFACPIVLAPLVLPAVALAHDQTLRRFESERRAAVARLGLETVDVRRERATCALTLHLADARASRPLPGLVRLHDVERDKPLQLRELVVREQGW